MNRILHVTPYFAPAYCYGGPPRSVLSLCRGLQELGVEVAVVTTSANGREELPPDVVQAGAYGGVPVRYVPRRFPKRYFVARGLRPLLESMIPEYDLVHVHGYWNYVCSTAAAICRRSCLPYVISPRGMLAPEGMARSRWKKRLAYRLSERANLAGAAAFHVTTEAERGRVAMLGLPPRLDVVPNIVDLNEFQDIPSGVEFRRRWGIGSEERVVITVGRVHPQKGLGLLLEALRRIGPARPAIRLVIVGGGDEKYREALEHEYQDVASSGRCLFVGHLQGPDRLEAYAAADVFVSASEFESFGMSVAEALVAGLPVVVSRECPWPQIEEWSCGCRVERTPAAFAETITSLLRDPERLSRRDATLSNRIRAIFGLQTIANQMRTLYEQCLEARRDIAVTV